VSVNILIGDVLARLAELPDDYFDIVVTSPPYWGLRDYGVVGQIGLEPTLADHITKMVEVFRELRRVLKPTGTCWMNYGDCYASAPNGRSAADGKAAGLDDRTFRDKPMSTVGGLIKAKDLLMLPNRLAVALQEPFYTGKISALADRVWLACLIDGEGSIFGATQPAGYPTGRDRKSVRSQAHFASGVTISNTCKALLDRCVAITGVGTVRPAKMGATNKRQAYVWRIGDSKAKAVLREVYPHLVAKQHEARLALGMPPSGDVAKACFEGLKALHRGEVPGIDRPAPTSLYEQGWFVRAECIWGKPNAMPDSSGSQRPAIAHEKIFMLTKSADADIWRARDTGELSFAPDLQERCALVTDPKRDGARWLKIGSYYDADEVKQGRASDEDANGYRGGSYVGGSPGPRTTKGNRRVKMPDGWDTGAGGHGSFHREGRGKGKTKEIRGRSTHGRHTLGNAIPSAERRAPNIDPAHAEGKSHTGLMALGRGEGRYLRNFEPAPLTVWEIAIEPFKGAHFATFPTELARRCLQAGCPKGGKVLDPFGGAGTTALVADRMGLDCTLIELSPEYADIARKRINGDMGLFGTVEVAA
jgi:hypothetical protein